MKKKQVIMGLMALIVAGFLYKTTGDLEAKIVALKNICIEEQDHYGGKKEYYVSLEADLKQEGCISSSVFKTRPTVKKSGTNEWHIHGAFVRNTDLSVMFADCGGAFAGDLLGKLEPGKYFLKTTQKTYEFTIPLQNKKVCL